MTARREERDGSADESCGCGPSGPVQSWRGCVWSGTPLGRLLMIRRSVLLSGVLLAALVVPPYAIGPVVAGPTAPGRAEPGPFAADAGPAAVGGGGTGRFVLTATNRGSSYAPTFTGNGYLGVRVPPDGQG